MIFDVDEVLHGEKSLKKWLTVCGKMAFSVSVGPRLGRTSIGFCACCSPALFLFCFGKCFGRYCFFCVVDDADERVSCP
jgi:hypothetical protein